jgi:ribosomal subunit interface protein
MAFPTITIKRINTEPRDALENLVQQKLDSLDKYVQEASALCEVEFEKLTTSQQGPIHRIEVNLQVDGALYRAEATEESFEKAVDEVRDELDKELRRYNKKRDTLMRRGGRTLKHLLRFGER